MSVVGVRSFRPADRAAVRDISYRSGFMGDSAESFWRHKESWADLWTSYYTDQEPESLHVATMDDAVVGYPAGCRNTAAMRPSTEELTKTVIRRHWLLFRPGTAGLLYRGLLDSLRDRERATGDFIDPRWPAHLHIDLLPAAGAWYRVGGGADGALAATAAGGRLTRLPSADAGPERPRAQVLREVRLPQPREPHPGWGDAGEVGGTAAPAGHGVEPVMGSSRRRRRRRPATA
jgi:hypothetical protein